MSNTVTRDMAGALDMHARGDIRGYSTLIGYIDRVSVATNEEGIVLDMANLKQRVFVGLTTIAANKTVTIINTLNAVVLSFIFTLGGTQTLTFPSNVRMQTADTRWTAGSKLFTPTEAGIYEASMVYDGTNWNLKISTPFT